MSNVVFLWLMQNMFLFIALMGIFAHFGAIISIKIAEMLGFGNDKPLSFVLDQIQDDLAKGKEVRVREYFNET